MNTYNGLDNALKLGLDSINKTNSRAYHL